MALTEELVVGRPEALVELARPAEGRPEVPQVVPQAQDKDFQPGRPKVAPQEVIVLGDDDDRFLAPQVLVVPDGRPEDGSLPPRGQGLAEAQPAHVGGLQELVGEEHGSFGLVAHHGAQRPVPAAHPSTASGRPRKRAGPDAGPRPDGVDDSLKEHDARDLRQLQDVHVEAHHVHRRDQVVGDGFR